MCSIDRQVVVSMEGVSWKVKQSLITTINGVDFVKLPASDVGFVKLVCGKAVPDKVPKNASLAGVQGMIELVRLRADASEIVRNEAPNDAEPSLFGEAAEQVPPKRCRRTAADVNEMREHPTTVNVTVSMPDGNAMVVPMIKAARGSDAVCVPMLNDIIDHVVLFIRAFGITPDSLLSKRTYSKSSEHGIWSAGDRGFVVLLSDGKYKRAKTIEDARRWAIAHEPEPLADQ
jgi:hypothetical protein